MISRVPNLKVNNMSEESQEFDRDFMKDVKERKQLKKDLYDDEDLEALNQ